MPATANLPPQRRPAPSPTRAQKVAAGGILPAMTAAKFGPVSLAMAGFVVYLWVLHSQKLPIAQPAILLGLLGVALSERGIRVSAPLLWFGAFIAWAFIAHFNSPYPTEAAATVWDYTKLWLIFLLALNVAHTRAELRMAAIAWLAIYALYPIRGTLFNVVFGISERNRFAWNFIFENPNDLATLTLPMLGLAIALLQTEHGKWFRRAAVIGAFLLPGIIILTQSRGGILALATFGALLFLSNRRKGRGIVLGTLAIGIMLAVAPRGVWDRLAGLRGVTNTDDLTAVDREGSADQRFEIWRVGMSIVSDYPLTGVGLGTYPLAHEEYAQGSRFRRTALGRRDTHSTYLNVLAETGFVGLLLFLGMLGSIVIPALRTAKRLRTVEPRATAQLRVLAFGLIAFLQACVFATMGHISFLYLYGALVITAVAIVREDAGMARSAAPRKRASRPVRGG